MNDLYTKHGGIPVYGIHISHSWHEIGAVLNVIYEHDVDCFIEIGIHRGGLGSLLLPYCYYKPEFSYLGFDIDRKIIEPSFLFFASMLDNAKLFYSDSTGKASIELAIETLQSAKNPMIYCDGGNKAKEFNVFSKIIQPGGIIMVHDYPKEFKEEHFKNLDYMERIEKPYLDEFNRQILFRKK